MPSRISGACNGCRSKKQKCSGDRSGCAQCIAAGIPCTWPEQRKRGPAKGYIDALEQRLHSAESLLLAILPRIDEGLLHDAIVTSTGSASQIDGDTSGAEMDDRRASRSSPPPLNKKMGVEYWESFPLDSVNSVRMWQHDCENYSSAQPASTRARGPSQSSKATHSTSLSQIRGDEERRSSMAAAAAIADLRHSTTSPGTPSSTSTSSMIAAPSSSRQMYENPMGPTRSLSIGHVSGPSTNITTHLPRQSQHRAHRQHTHPHQHQHQQPSQPSMWYQQYPPPASTDPHTMNVNMTMAVDQNFASGWSNTQSTNAMDVDPNPIQGDLTTPQQRGGPGQNNMYQGDFSQNIFW